MQTVRVVLSALVTLAACSLSAHAHFPWLVLTPEERPTQAAVYFGESAAPDDPELLDKVAHADVYLLAGRRSEPRQLELTKSDDALVADLGDAAQATAAALNLEYGVITRGGAPFLLKYYAKAYPSALTGTWRALDRPEILPLEITPRFDAVQAVLRVTWEGKPAAGVEVNVGGPGLTDNITGVTDESGDFRCDLADSGLYSLRAKFVEQTAGELDQQSYSEVRHYSTLTIDYVRPSVTTAAHSWPALPRGITSFGAAVAGDWLYVYGGHLGAAHSYSQDEQSNEFRRLNLAQPTEWESLPGGPRLTGLTMVAHGGKLYRIGGFAALNKAGEDDKLVSQADVARFDPQTMQWEELPSLPAGRSSVDAAVIGDTLYVVGGWNLQAGSDPQWHDSALSMNLAADTREWKAIAPPGFQRRAISVAAWDGKLYVIGGMQPEGGSTTRVAVYDPARDAWSEGPQLRGGSMDGFGTAAFATADRLTVTTMSGSIQELSADGTWNYAGQLAQPRFFHRMLPWRSDLVLVGGADMSVGKREQLERIPAR
jgi:N-acetylneuraminic acid mutarotase